MSGPYRTALRAGFGGWVSRRPDGDREFDYVVVGAGAAGCVVANRLSEDAANRVLLLEHGGADLDPRLYIPKGFVFTISNPRYTYRYPTLPVGPEGSVETWIRGRVTGGSTALNGMMYSRGAAADYDALAARGLPGWGWPEMLGAFRAIEDHRLGESALRGSGGPLVVSLPHGVDTISDALVAAGESLGWRHATDTNDGDDERIGRSPATIDRGVRVSAASAFLHPVRNRENLFYRDRTRVGQLVLDGSRVVGVQARTAGDGPRVYCAAREVVVCAGTVQTPLLLERSGIGRPEVLAAAGVDVAVESPNVGERVIEQRAVNMQVRLRIRGGHTERLNSLPKQLWEGLGYLLTRRGPNASGGYDLVCHFRSSPEADRPDVQGIWSPFALDRDHSGLKLAGHSGFHFTGYPLRPSTRGSVHLGGPAPEDPPVVNARYLETEEDRRVTATILERARRVVAASALASLATEEFPGPDVSSPAEVVRHALEAGGGIYHAVGSAAMGPHDTDVVDGSLRVRGTGGLRVVDASVFPEHPSGNTAAPTMALAWRASEVILAER
jgi:choline dehydrogenase-like flavoprotein